MEQDKKQFINKITACIMDNESIREKLQKHVIQSTIDVTELTNDNDEKQTIILGDSHQTDL